MRTELRQVRRTIVGTAEGIATALDTAARQGRLVSVTAPRPHEPGTYVVSAVLVERTAVKPAQRPAKPRSAPRVNGWYLALSVLALAVLVAFLVVLVIAVQWAIAHAAVLAGIAFGLVALLLTLRTKAGVCMGLHCEGCGHR